MPDLPDQWTAAASYEDFMGRWSRLLAPRFLEWLQPQAGLHWLEVGCGTGSLTGAVCREAAPASLVACDPAAPFIEHARGRVQDPRATFVVAGVGALPDRAGGYGSITSLLALNFFPDRRAALHEMRALAANGATISACVWDYAGRMEFLRYFWDAARAEGTDAVVLDEAERFPDCNPEALDCLFRDAGLEQVRCDGIEIPTRFADFEDYWRPLMGGTGPVPSYVASLDPDRRAALRRRLAASVPGNSAGEIELVARAWAVCGRAR